MDNRSPPTSKANGWMQKEECYQLIQLAFSRSRWISTANRFQRPIRGKWVHPVVNEDGRLLPTDETGRFVDVEGEVIPVDDFGRPVDSQGKILPTNRKGEPVVVVIGPDGQPLTTDARGRHLDAYGEPIPLDESGQYIYPPPPTRVPVVVIGPDGQPMPTDTSGRIVDKQGSPYPTNYDGLLLGPDGSPLPTNADGQVVVAEGDQEEKTQKAVTLPTDDYGKLVYPIVGSDGQPLPTDQSGRYLDVASGEPIPTDDFGRPLHTEGGQILPKNQQGDYIYSKPSKTPKKVVVIGPDGVPQPTDYQGKWVDAEGRALPTNPEGLLVGPDGSPLPTNAQGQQVVGEGAEGIAKVLPTDASGLPIYPILNSDGQLLPTDSTGKYVDVKSGKPIPTDNAGKPLSSEGGEILPQNSEGKYIYSGPGAKEDQEGQPPVRQDSRGDEVVAYPADTDSVSLDKDKPCLVNATVVDIVFAINDELLEMHGDSIKEALTDLFSTKNGNGGYFDLSPDATRISLLHYGRSVDVPVNLGGYHERAQLLDKLNVYKAAQQQFASFGRPNVAKFLVVFSNGDDILPNSLRHILNDQRVSTILIGLSSYESEIDDESHLRILLKEWSDLRASNIANYLQERCHSGVINLPTSRAIFVKQHAPDSILSADSRPTSTPAESITGAEPETSTDKSNGEQISEKCLELQERTRIVLAVETSHYTANSKSELQRILLQFIRDYVEKLGSKSQVGILYYGNTVEVTADIGGYANNEELEENVSF
uniref:VWFA domain-containing protein n=1 Tax=Ditylenchus dipsaci TaxID=166011 RepID=A0A915ESJ3_9BILA